MLINIEKHFYFFCILFIQLIVYIMLMLSYGNYYAVPLMLLVFIILPALPLSLILKKIDKTLNVSEAFHIAITFMLFLSIFMTLIFDKKASIILILFSLMLNLLYMLSEDNTIVKKFKLKITKRSDFKSYIKLETEREILWLLENIILSLILLPLLTYLFKNVPRLYLGDETSYAFYVQLFEQYKVMFSYGDIYSKLSSIMKYFTGRTIWLNYLYSVSVLSGVKPSELYFSNILFLILVSFVSLDILKDILNVDIYKLAIMLYIISLPVVLPWGITILLDLPQTYFILISFYFILKSIDWNANFSVNLSKFYYFFIFALYSILFKENIVSFFFLLIIFIILLQRHKHQLSNSAKFLLKILKYIMLFLLTYIAIIDFGRVLCILFVKNNELCMFLRRYFIFPESFAELMVGMFVEFPWDRYTLFSFSWRQWLDFLNFALAPEALSPLLSAIFIVLPALSVLCRDFSADLKFKLLAFTASSAYWFYFFTLIGVNNWREFTRYCLHLYILMTLLSVTVIYRIVRNHNNVRKWFLFLSILMVLILIINYKVSTEFGGTRFFFDMSRYERSSTLLLVESMLIGCALAAARRSSSISFVALMLILFVFSQPFLKAVFDKSWLFLRRSDALKEVSSYLEGSYKGGKILVISNAYIYLRNYLDLSKFIVIPPPIDENEFFEMLKVLPDGSYLVLTNDPAMAWYEYANNYIKKYINSNRICIEANERCAEVKKVYEIKRDKYMTAIFVKKGQFSSWNISDRRGLWLHLVNVTYTETSCILSLKGNINRTNIILATIRFSKLIKASPGVIIIPKFHNNDPLKNIREAIYICTYNVAIALDDIDVIWLYMNLKFSYMENILFLGALTFLSIIFFIVNALRKQTKKLAYSTIYCYYCDKIANLIKN
ncbi:MAG: hypothetical protein LM590_06850 [Thermofilum sp.]|nr:hypothetical protein [Thermofilum sp.]